MELLLIAGVTLLAILFMRAIAKPIDDEPEILTDVRGGQHRRVGGIAWLPAPFSGTCPCDQSACPLK